MTTRILIIIISAALLAGTSIGGGTYIAGKKSAELESLQSDVASLKDQLAETPAPFPTSAPAEEPESSPTPEPSKAAPAPAVKSATTAAAKPKVDPTPTPQAPAPTPTPTPKVDKRQECEQHALSAKSKFVIQLEEMKAKYQPQHDKNYYGLISQGRHEEATLLQAQWQQGIANINNSMAHAYDIALSDCLAR